MYQTKPKILNLVCITGAQTFEESRSHLKILGSKRWHEKNSILRIHKY
jgi:hypothetical protein